MTFVFKERLGFQTCKTLHRHSSYYKPPKVSDCAIFIIWNSGSDASERMPPSSAIATCRRHTSSFIFWKKQRRAASKTGFFGFLAPLRTRHWKSPRYMLYSSPFVHFVHAVFCLCIYIRNLKCLFQILINIVYSYIYCYLTTSIMKVGIRKVAKSKPPA